MKLFNNKNDNFINFCLNEIKKKIENLTFENEQGIKIKIDKTKKCDDKKIYDKIKQFVTSVMKFEKEIKNPDLKKIEEFANIYDQIQKNINSMNLYKKSNSIDFFNSLYNIIINSSKTSEKEYKEYLKYTIEHFNNFFSVDIKNKKNDKEKESIQIRKIFFDQFNKEIKNSKNNINKIFDEMENELEKYLKIKTSPSEIKDFLKVKNENDLNKSLDLIGNEMKDITKKYVEMIDKEIKNLNDKIEQLRLKYIEKINSLIKNEETLVNTNKLLKTKSISYSSTLENFATISLGIGGSGILAASFGISLLSGVGVVVSGVLAAVGIVGYIFSPSKKKKFTKAIEKALKNLKKNITSKKREFLLSFNDHYQKLKDNYENETSLQISNLEGLKIEKFNESKEKFLKAKNLLLKESK